MADASARSARRVETAIAVFTLAVLPLYVLLETWYSLPGGLTDPYYVVDAIAMALLAAGAIRSLRARPKAASGLLCGAYGWAAANGFRATSWRLLRLAEGGTLDMGTPEAVVVTGTSAAALAIFAVLVVMQWRAA